MLITQLFETSPRKRPKRALLMLALRKFRLKGSGHFASKRQTRAKLHRGKDRHPPQLIATTKFLINHIAIPIEYRPFSEDLLLMMKGAL